MALVPAVVTLLSVLLVFHFGASWFGDSTYRRLGYVAILGHTLAGLLVLYVLPYSWDIGQFHGAGLAVLSGEPVGESTTVSSFAAFQGLLYSIFGAHPIVVSIVNGLLAVLMAVFALAIACRLYPGLRERTLLLTMVLFSPLPFLYLSVPMRDALTTAAFFLTLSLAAVALVDERYWFFLPIVPLFGGLYLLRPELALLSALGIAAAGGVAIFNRVAQRRATLPLLAGAGAGTGLVGLALFFDRFPLSRLNGALNWRSRGGAAYLDWMEYDGVLDVLIVAPTRAIYFQFAPFPLQVTSPFDLLAALTIPLLIFLLVAGYWSVRRYEVEPVVLTLLLTVYFGGIVGYGLIDSNFGTAVRHRIPFEFILIAFAAPALGRVERLLRGLVEQPQTQTGGDDE